MEPITRSASSKQVDPVGCSTSNTTPQYPEESLSLINFTMKELIKFWALSLFFIGCFVSWYWYSRPVRSQDDETNKPIVQKQTRPNLIWPYWATMVRLMSRGKKIDTMVYFCASVLQNEIEKMTSSCSSVRLWVQFRVSSGCSTAVEHMPHDSQIVGLNPARSFFAFPSLVEWVECP